MAGSGGAANLKLKSRKTELKKLKNMHTNMCIESRYLHGRLATV
jgi:hypothetical protein